jgi:hypothetical protein
LRSRIDRLALQLKRLEQTEWQLYAAQPCASTIRKSISARASPARPSGITQTDRIWLVSLIDDDIGFFDDETCKPETLANRFGAKLLPTSSV